MNSTVTPGEFEIRLEFNSRIDRQRSRVILLRPDGSESPLALIAGTPSNVLAGHAEATASGLWKVDWQVLSLDGHITRGELRFLVREKATTP